MVIDSIKNLGIDSHNVNRFKEKWMWINSNRFKSNKHACPTKMPMTLALWFFTDITVSYSYILWPFHKISRHTAHLWPCPKLHSCPLDLFITDLYNLPTSEANTIGRSNRTECTSYISKLFNWDTIVWSQRRFRFVHTFY